MEKNKIVRFASKLALMVSLEELIPNPELDFLNSDLKIHFWTNLGGKSIPCLFLFETLLLFLDILLLYFTGGSESTKCLYFYFIVSLTKAKTEMKCEHWTKR